MRIDWWTLGLQTINALVLIFLLARFLFRPVAAIIEERKSAVARMMDEAGAAQAAAQARAAEAARALAEISKDRAAALLAATDEAKVAKEALLAAARDEVERLRTASAAEISRLRASERRAEAERASLLAVDIARRLFERLPQQAQVAGFIDGLAEALAALPDEARQDFGRDGLAVLVAPRALTKEEEALCGAAFAKALGHPLDLDIRIDAAMLAGLELENQHVNVRNSFLADLARIAAEFSAKEET